MGLVGKLYAPTHPLLALTSVVSNRPWSLTQIDKSHSNASPRIRLLDIKRGRKVNALNAACRGNLILINSVVSKFPSFISPSIL